MQRVLPRRCFPEWLRAIRTTLLTGTGAGSKASLVDVGPDQKTQPVRTPFRGRA